MNTMLLIVGKPPGYMKRSDVFGLLALVVCLGAILFFVLAAPEREPQIYAPVEVAGSALVLQPSQEAGASHVAVDSTLAKSGFVTVHRAFGDAPADVLGVSEFLTPGNYSDLLIPLSTPTEAGSSYFVLMFLDDGDGVYEPRVDLPVMTDGKVIKEKLIL